MWYQEELRSWGNFRNWNYHQQGAVLNNWKNYKSSTWRNALVTITLWKLLEVLDTWVCQAARVHGGWESIRWRARQLTLHFSTLCAMRYRTGIVRLGEGLWASLTPTLGGPQYWPGTSPSSDCSWSGIVERGSSFGFWPRRNLHSWFLVSWSRDTWAGWKGRHGRLWLPLQGHSLWPGNLSRVGSLHGAPSSAGLPRCGLGPILKAQAFQRVGKTLVRQVSARVGVKFCFSY